MGVERLAGGAGISRTSFCFYFRDEREVLELLTATAADELCAAADIWWSGTGVSHEALRTPIEDVSALFVQHGPLLRAIVEVGTYEREVADARAAPGTQRGSSTRWCSPVIALNSPVCSTRATSASISSSLMPGRVRRRRSASMRRSLRISSTVTR